MLRVLGVLGVLVLGVLVVPGSAQTPPPTMEQAVALAREGHHRDALAAFQRMVAAAPNDLDARVWIGRLHGWLGETRAAEDVYRAVLRENSAHVEAMVALGSLLTNAGRLDDAFVILADAERIAPASGDVLAAAARARFFAGETTAAVQYIERAAAIAPTPEYRRLREQILRAHRHRVELTGFGEHFTADIPRGLNGEVAVALRLTDRLRVSARGQAQDKFNIAERRAGGGVEWRLTRALRVAGSLLAGADTVVLPRLDANVEVGLVRGRSDWSASYRRIEFDTAEVSVFSPGAALSLNDRVTLIGRYALALTDFAAAPKQTTHSAGGGISVLTGTRVWLSAGYSRGIEKFETLSLDRIGAFRADTIAGGARVELPGLTTIAAVYERQWRTRGTNMGRMTIALAQRF